MLLIVYCLLVVAASLAGGYLPSVLRLSHTRLQVVMSLVGGLMLGVGVLHLLPHGFVELEAAGGDRSPIDLAVGSLMLGMLGMFFLLRIFHFHQHGPIEQDPRETAGTETDAHADHDHAHHHHSESCNHGHGHDHGQMPTSMWSWIGVAIGLTLHTLIDGLALGAAVIAEQQAHAGHHHGWWPPAGLGIFLAIVLHKPLDAMSITSMMGAGGWSVKARFAVNLTFSMMCPAGALLFWAGFEGFQGAQQHLLIGCALSAAAGVFLCISLGDLLPELQFHGHDRGKLSAALLVGVLIAYGIGFLEAEHVHGHRHGPAEVQTPDEVSLPPGRE